MPRHVWGGPEMRTPEGLLVWYREPPEEPCPPPRRPQGPLSWFRANPAQSLTLVNVTLLLTVFLFLTYQTDDGVALDHGWRVRAEFFEDGEGGLLSLRFESPDPQIVSFEVVVGENERSLLTFGVVLKAESHQVVRRRLDRKPPSGLQVWIQGKKIPLQTFR